MIGKKFLASAASMAVGVGLLLTSTGVATAADTTFPNADYGFDGNSHLVVGAGSVTVYTIAQGFADLYNKTVSCQTNNSTFNTFNNPPTANAYPPANPTDAAFNQCDPTTQTYNGVNSGGNYDGDVFAIATSTGSSTGIATLNQNHNGTAGTWPYEGTNANLPTTPTNQLTGSNGFGTPDFAISSRAAKTTGGNCAGGNELTCDTFWGVAADGVQVFTWGSTVGGTSDKTDFAGTLGLTPTDLFNVWECIDTTWGQLSQYSAAAAAGDPVPPANAPIVPWSMNSGSGTYADFNTYVENQTGNTAFTADDKAAMYSATNPGGSATSPTPPTGSCARELSNANQPTPIENDVKPPLEDVQANQGGLNQDPLSTNNPANWLWFGSNGLLSAFPYLSSPSLFGNSYVTVPQALNGTAPSASTVGTGTYPAERILNIVTRSTDATCPMVSGVCNLTGGPVNANGTTDLNVPGASSGVGGAVREFVRFLCRTKAENNFTSGTATAFSPTDPYTGTGDFTLIGQVISGSGFTLPPTADRSAGSNCDVTA